MAAERWTRQYLSDAGPAYLVLVPKYWTNVLHRQWDTGMDPGNLKLPPGMIMRHCNLKSADGKRRRNLPISRREGGFWPFLGATLVLPNIDGTNTTWTVVGHNSERYQPRKYKQKRR